MYRKRLIELSKVIGELVKSIKLVGIEIDAHNRCIDEQKVKLIPEGGWPGKNDTERKASELKMLAENEELTQMVLAKREIENKQTVMEADLALFTEERRGIEFAVRDALAYALGGYNDDETEKVLDISIDKKAHDLTKTPIVAPLNEVIKETADGSFELPAIPEGTPVTKVMSAPIVEAGPVKFDPVAQEFVKDASFDPNAELPECFRTVEVVYDPEVEKDIPEVFRKKAPEEQIGLPSGAQAPTTDIEIPHSVTVETKKDVDVDQMLKDMGF
jgi:hypothetical protein